MLPGSISLSVSLTGGLRLGVPVVDTDVSAIASSTVTVTVTHRNKLNIVRGGVAVRTRTRRIRGMGHSRDNIVVSPFFLAPSRLISRTRGLVDGCHVDNIPIIGSVRSHGLMKVLAGHSLQFVTSCRIPVNSIVAGRRLIATPMKASLGSTRSVLRGCGVRGLPLISSDNHLTNLVAVGSVRGMVRFPGSTGSTRNHLVITTTMNIADSAFRHTRTLLSTNTSTVIVSATRNRDTNIVHGVGRVHSRFPSTALVTKGMTATRKAHTLFSIKISMIGIKVKPNSVYAAHIMTNINIPRVATVCSTTDITERCNGTVVTSNKVGCSKSVIGTVTTNKRTIVLNDVLTNASRSPNRFRVFRNHHFGACHNVNDLTTVRGNSDSHCFRNKIGRTGGVIPRNVRNHITCGKTTDSVVFRLLNNIHSNVNCINTNGLRRLHRGTRFVGVSNTKLVRSRPRSVRVAGRTPGCSVREWANGGPGHPKRYSQTFFLVFTIY